MWLGNEQFSQFCEDMEVVLESDIPLEDTYSIKMYKEYAWVYDKRKLYDYQNLRWFPHGMEPEFLPCFSKPFENLWGMGIDTCVCTDSDDYYAAYKPAHLCMEILAGEHSCLDVVVDNCRVYDWRYSIGHNSGLGMFTHWEYTSPDHTQELALLTRKKFVLRFIEDHLSQYRGCVNFEFIDDHCIEVHLRPNMDMMLGYGKGYIVSVANFYNGQNWSKPKLQSETCYTVPVWGKLNKRYRIKKADREQLSARFDPNIEHVYWDVNDWDCAHPPGGQRLAIVAGYNYTKVKEHAEKLSNYFNGGRTT